MKYTPQKLKDEVTGPKPIASITINFYDLSEGDADVEIKNVRNISIGRIERTLPRVFSVYQVAMLEERRKEERQREEAKGKELEDVRT